MINGGPVFTKSQKQKLNCKSSTEAELIALSDMLSPILWMKNLMSKMNRGTPKVTVREDNMSVIAMVKRGKSTNERTRHIKLRYFFIADYVRRGDLNLEHCFSERQLADHFSKTLPESSFIPMNKTIINIKENVNG